MACLFPSYLHGALFTMLKVHPAKLEAAAAAASDAAAQAPALAGTSGRAAGARRRQVQGRRGWVACCNRLLSQSAAEVERLRRMLLEWVVQQAGVMRCEGSMQVRFRLSPEAHLHAGVAELQGVANQWLTTAVEVKLP